MSSKKREKSPYGEISVKEVMKAEDNTFYIQLGDDMFCSESGKLAFKKDKAEFFYDRIMEGLRDMRNNGSEEEKEDAHMMLLHIRIYPLRIH